jgi:hypothetical protein
MTMEALGVALAKRASTCTPVDERGRVVASKQENRAKLAETGA